MKKRVLGILLVLSLCLPMFPNVTWGTAAADETELCPHHTEHTEECGYVEAVEGLPCTHEHNEECGYLEVTEDISEELLCDKDCIDEVGVCTHEHDEDCGYVEAIEAQPCTFVCNICSHIVSGWTWGRKTSYEALTTGEELGMDGVNWVLAAPGLDDNDLRDLLPETIIAAMKDGTEAILPITWDLKNKQYDKAASSDDVSYMVTADLPDSYTLDEETPELDVLIRTTEISSESTGTSAFYAQAVFAASFALTGNENEWALKNRDNFEMVYPDAMHFYIRHWHSTATPVEDDTLFQGSPQINAGRYCIVVEGYILPPEETDGEHQFYFVYQENSENKGQVAQVDDPTDSPYIDTLYPETGIIRLNAIADESNGESFSAFSISAGHEAVDYVDNDITIAYKDYIPLVKGHVFYINDDDLRIGSKEDALFGFDEGSVDLEIDTIDTFVVVDEDGSSKAVRNTDGAAIKASEIEPSSEELVKLKKSAMGQDGQVNEKRLEELIENFRARKFEELTGRELNNDVMPATIYYTAQGLHTNKMAAEHLDARGNSDDGTRTFDMTLEAWYTEQDPPSVGMVLDASGSMGFAANTPQPIKVNDIIDALEEIGESASAAMLKAKIGYAGENGFASKDEEVGFPGYEHLLGYYELEGNKPNSGNDRTWYLNSKKKTPSKDYNSMNQKTDFAKAARQVSLGGEIDFSKTTDGVKNSENYLPLFSPEYTGKGWGSDGAPSKFGDTYGLSLCSTAANSAFVPEDQPEGDSFTLSFTLRQIGEDVADFTGSKKIEILYVGPETTQTANNDYFHVYRQGGDVYAYMGQSEQLFKLSTGFTNGRVSKITFVFDNGTVKAYLNGVLSATASIADLNGTTVVFAPFTGYQTGQQGADGFFAVDSIYLYDTALTPTEIDNLISVAGNRLTETITVSTDAFLTDAELALLMNPKATDNSALSMSGYNYFIYDARESTREYVALGYYNNTIAGNVLDTNKNNVTGAGWYYASSGNYNDNKKTKTMRGVAANTEYTDTIADSNVTCVEKGTQSGAAPHVDNKRTNSNKSYTVKQSGPIKFYIDEDSYLRCFFAPDLDNRLTSYVYELGDRNYVKTESLQRAIGDFVTRLNEKSPESKVSAVKFSKNMSEDLMVLLDWTNDASVSAQMLSLNPSKEGLENNYFLTGGTHTDEGLAAFKNKLSDSAKIGKGKKYLIIFTDGQCDGNIDKAKETANKLKEAGYTIYSVLMAGGALASDGSAEQNNAIDFLASLSGTKKGESDKNYVLVADADDPDALIETFSDRILKNITIDQSSYTVQDYLDPRFDLVVTDENGAETTWFMKANGVVEIGDEKYNLIKGTGGNIKMDFDDADGYYLVTPIASGYKDSSTMTEEEEDYQARLYYDKEKDVYYLKWVNQTIPGCTIGATRLSVWSSTFTIRAKEDFIGGNAVLTNGNEELMNMVYADNEYNISMRGSSDALKVSSGTDKSQQTTNPSKGFPRVSVNVTPPKENIDMGQTIYMGERLDRNTIARMIIDEAKKDETNGSQNYWRYVERFVNYFNSIAGTEAGNKIIDTLHQMNRSGEYIPAGREDKLDLGYMKIISNRIYDLIYGNISPENPNGDKLSVEALSALLMSDATIIDTNVPGEQRTERYLYIPYIYLPDDPDSPSNSTGTGEYMNDVVGYLFFHIDEQHKEGDYTYPEYPKEDGITKTTETYMSQLTVSFIVRSANDRALWNNSQAIQETSDTDTAPGLVPIYNSKYGWPNGKDENGNPYPTRENVEGKRVYKRNTTYKPAVGIETDTETDPIVVKGTFKTKVVSGEIQLQIQFCNRLSENELNALYNKPIMYEANLYRTYERMVPDTGENGAVPKYEKITDLVGVLSYKGEVKAITNEDAQQLKVFVEKSDFKPVDGYSYTDYENGYGLPLGTYTVVPVSLSAPSNFGFSDVWSVEASDSAYDWVEQKGNSGGVTNPNPDDDPTMGVNMLAYMLYDAEPTEDNGEPDTADQGKSRVFQKGTGWNDYAQAGEGWENQFIADIGAGTTIVLGYGQEEPVYRFGLERLQIDIVGDLEISKNVICGDDEMDKAMHYNDDFTFEVELTVPNEKDPDDSESKGLAELGVRLSSTYQAQKIAADGTIKNLAVYVKVTTESDGSQKGEVFADKNYTKRITLKHDESIIIYGISAGVQFDIRETDKFLYKMVGKKVTQTENKSQKPGEPNEPGKSADPEGEDGESSGAIDTIVWNTTTTVAFTNQAQHKLVITKTVTGAEGEKSKDWNFTVTLDGVENKFSLKDSQFNEFHISCGTTYHVKEEEANLDDYGTTVSVDGSGTVEESEAKGTLTADTTVRFVNRKPYGGVVIHKNVVSPEESDKNRPFTFNVTITPKEGAAWPDTRKFYYTKTDETDTKIVEVTKNSEGNYVLEVDLTDGQEVHIQNIPEGTTVKVEEVQAKGFEAPAWGECKVTRKTDTGVEDVKHDRIDLSGFTVEGELYLYEFTCTNTRTCHDLEIAKEVTGNTGNRQEEFEFTISLLMEKSADNLTENEQGKNEAPLENTKEMVALAGTYKYSIFDTTVEDGPKEIKTGEITVNEDGLVYFEDGSNVLKLKHGQYIVIKDLPENVEFTIVEKEATDYKTTVTGTVVNEGNKETLTEGEDYTYDEESKTTNGVLIGGDITVTYTNDRTASIPTNATSEFKWLIPILMVSCMGLIWFLSNQYERKKRRRSRRT